MTTRQSSHNTAHRCPIFCVVPPHLLEKMVESKDKAVRQAALRTLMLSSQVRGARLARSGMSTPSGGGARRTVFDARRSQFLSDAVLARSEEGPESTDESVNRLFNGLGSTRDFLLEVFNRNSLDDNGMRLDGYVHFGRDFNNALFDGRVMLFGDGDGETFTDFTKSLDVIAHELGHGVTQFTADLVYQDQPGALNEHMSDVIGSLVKQWVNGQTVEEADWLIGADVWTPGMSGDALRSMKEPGKAYVNHPIFGTDPQPAHMSQFDHGPGDNGGVHINSGIPNKAFYESAKRIGGFAWEVTGQIWYEALKASTQRTEFQEFADRCFDMAQEFGSDAQRAVADGWNVVGIRVTGAAPERIRGPRRGREVALGDIMNELARIAARVDALSKGKVEPFPKAGLEPARGRAEPGKNGHRYAK
jgi:Zn-dependent metalloprotease